MKKLKLKLQYRLMVVLLKIVARLSKSYHPYTRGILMDAEGDSRYYEVRR